MTGDAVAIECGFELVVSAFRRTFLRRLGDEWIGVQIPGHGGQHPAREGPQSTAHRHGYRRPQSVTENRGKSTSTPLAQSRDPLHQIFVEQPHMALICVEQGLHPLREYTPGFYGICAYSRKLTPHLVAKLHDLRLDASYSVR